MKLKGIIAATAVLALIAACGNGKNDNSPAPDDLRKDAFIRNVAYTAEATVGRGTERIVLTVGMPLTAAQYKKTDKPGGCSLFTGSDLVVPLTIEVSNTSAPSTGNNDVGVTLHTVLDYSQMEGKAFALAGQDDSGACRQQMPLGNTTTKPATVGQKRTSFSLQSSADLKVPPGEKLVANIYLFLTGGTQPTPPLSALFLRLTPTHDQPGRVKYTITKLTAQKVGADGEPGRTLDLAAVLTGGANKGTFYVPLDGSTYPCTTLGKNAPMACGAELNAPK